MLIAVKRISCVCLFVAFYHHYDSSTTEKKNGFFEKIILRLDIYLFEAFDKKKALCFGH